jgi:hypothetical protein
LNTLNKKGQTLVQAVVGMVLMMTLGLIITAVVSSVQSMVGDMDRVLKVEELHSEIMLLLSDPLQCKNTFYRYAIPASGGSTVIPAGSGIRIKDDSIRFLTNSVIGSRDLRIETMTAKEFTGNASGVSFPYTGRFTFEIQYSYKVNPTAPDRLQTRHIRIKSLPVDWNPGTPIVDNTKAAGCSAGLGATTGLDLGPFVTRGNLNNFKYNIFRINGKVDIMQNILGANATSLKLLSDERLKTEFQTIAPDFEKMKNVNGYTFNWKDSKKSDYGFMADEVEKLDAKLVDKQSSGNSAVQYQGLVPILHQSLVSLNKNSIDLEKRIKKLKNKK